MTKQKVESGVLSEQLETIRLNIEQFVHNGPEKEQRKRLNYWRSMRRQFRSHLETFDKIVEYLDGQDFHRLIEQRLWVDDDNVLHVTFSAWYQKSIYHVKAIVENDSGKQVVKVYHRIFEEGDWQLYDVGIL